MTDASLFHDGTSWIWNDTKRFETGMTYVPAGAASGWWAHALEPHTPVAWVCDDEDGLDALAAAFGPEWLARSRAACSRRPNDDGTVDPTGAAPPRLTDAWARLVVVRSLARWYPEPIDELALRVDEAIAWDAVGDAERASAAIGVGVTALASIAMAMWGDTASDSSNPLPAYCDALVETAIALARRELPEDDEDLALLNAILSNRIEVPRLIGSTIAEEAERWLSSFGALTAGARGESDMEVIPVAPATVTARVLEWTGPFDPGVRATRGGDEIVVSVTLGPDSHIEHREVRNLAGFACDKATGEILARTMIRDSTDGRVVSGTLRVAAGRDVAVGVFELDRIEALHTDPLGRHLARIDRLAIARWAGLRKEALARALGNDSPDAVTLGHAAAEIVLTCTEQVGAARARVRSSAMLDADAASRFAAAAALAVANAPQGTAVFGSTLAEALVTLPASDADGAI